METLNETEFEKKERRRKLKLKKIISSVKKISIFLAIFCVFWITITLILPSMYTVFLLWYVAIPLGIFLPLFVLGIFIAKPLANKPFTDDENGKAVPNTFGFFTALAPGQVKMIVREGHFIRCIMDYKGHTFAGLKERDPDAGELEKFDFWKVVESADDDDAVPLPLPKFKFLFDLFFFTYRYPWWLWKIFVRAWTGFVFTGIPPFQTVRIYPFEYFKEQPTVDGTFTLIKKSNYSDHYRVNKLDIFIPVTAVAGLIPLKIVVGFTGRISNPWLAAYKTGPGGWATRTLSVLTSAVNDYTRPRTIDDILSNDADGLSNHIKLLGWKKNDKAEVSEFETEGNESTLGNPPFWDFGLEVSEVQIPARLVADPKSQLVLSDRAFAIIEAEATKNRAQGNADAIEITTNAITKGGDDGRLAATIEGTIRTVKASGDKSIINIGGGNSDIFTRAIFSEVKQNNGKLESGTKETENS